MSTLWEYSFSLFRGELGHECVPVSVCNKMVEPLDPVLIEARLNKKLKCCNSCQFYVGGSKQISTLITVSSITNSASLFNLPAVYHTNGICYLTSKRYTVCLFNIMVTLVVWT